MANSTHAHLRRRLVYVLVVAVLAVGAMLASAAGAHADGDPASDVLSTSSLFLPSDAGESATQQAQLQALLVAAARDGYVIRVAIIASPGDLGSVTPFWREPATYARFLGIELSLTYRGPLLVVMPDGFGLHGGAVTAERAAVAGITLRATRGSLGAAAVTAVQRLAAAAGHRLTVPTVTAPTARPGSSDPAPLIAFAVGCALIALAWSASLRARPHGLS